MPPIIRNIPQTTALMALLQPMVEALMTTEADRLKGQLQTLLKQNVEQGGSKDAYTHRGEVYSLLPRVYLRGTTILPITPSLVPQAEDYRLSLQAVERDTRRIRQALSVVVPRCSSKQEIRDVLPESLAAQIPDFRGMERHHTEGFVLKDMPDHLEQFQEAMNLAISYQANQLIF